MEWKGVAFVPDPAFYTYCIVNTKCSSTLSVICIANCMCFQVPTTMASDKRNIEIRVSCKHLKNKDASSKSDPICAMYVKKGDEWIEVNILHSSLLSCPR